MEQQDMFRILEWKRSAMLMCLQSHYGTDEVQRNLMTKLAGMKPFEQSNKAMRYAVDELFATVRVLRVQGVTPAQYGVLLMPLIESKLPKDWRLELA